MIGNGSVGNLNGGLPQPTSMIYYDKYSSPGFSFQTQIMLASRVMLFIRKISLVATMWWNQHS